MPVSSPSNIMHHWLEDFAVRHDGLDPRNLTWQRSYGWDRQQANGTELWERESDIDRLEQAIELWKSDDLSTAFLIWRELAEQGSIWSMIDLAICYENGDCLPRDFKEAESWYKRAFAGGSQFAMLKCAKFAASRQDFTACEAILKVGVDQDWTPAIFWLAWYRHKQSESKATYRGILPLLQTAARRGHPAAQWNLNNFMVRGKFGLLRIPLGFLLVLKFSLQEVRADTRGSDEVTA